MNMFSWVAGHEGSSGEIKVRVLNSNLSVESRSSGVGSCEAESELHGTATVFSRFLSGVVKSV